MNAKEYWAVRQEKALLKGEKTASEVLDKIKTAYKQAERNLSRELKSQYAKYAIDNNLTLSEAQKRLATKDRLVLLKIQQDYIKEAKLLSLDPKYIKELKVMSKRAQITKLEAILASLRHEVEMLSQEIEAIATDTLITHYKASYENTVDDFKQFGAVADKTFTTPSKTLIQEAVQQTWQGSDFSTRIWTNKAKLVQQLNIQIPRGIAEGKSVNKIANEMSQALNTSFSNTSRLVRTEMNRITNEAEFKVYKDAELEQYEILATLDSHTSDICSELNGKIFNVKDAEIGINKPPFHVHCRSTTIPYFDDKALEKLLLADDNVNNEQTNNNNTEIPKTLANLTDDVLKKQHEESFKVHGWTKEQQQNWHKFMTEVIDNNDFAMRMSYKTLLDKLPESGEFKNQLETGTSRGVNNTERRRNLSNKMFNSDIDNMEASDFEKYGYLAKKGWNLDQAQRYGSVKIVFDKDKIKDRVTYTIGDSLDCGGERGEIYASKVTNPQNALPKNLDLKYEPNKRTYSNIINGKLNQDDFKSLVNDAGEVANSMHELYIELQYHGKLTLDDVKEIVITPNHNFRKEDAFKLMDYYQTEKNIPLKCTYFFEEHPIEEYCEKEGWKR